MNLIARNETTLRTEVRIGVIQFHPARAKPETNRETLIELLEQAVDQRAQLIVCPEMAISGYLFQSEQDLYPYAEKDKGESFGVFSEFARKHGVYLAYGYAELSNNRLFNSQNLIAPNGELLLKYRKRNLYEADTLWAKGGKSGYQSVVTPFGKIGLGICMDLNSDAFLRWHNRQGTQIMLFSANWLFSGYSPMSYWLDRWRKFEGIAALSNRHGKEFDTLFCGQSGVFEKGELLAALPSKNNGVLVTSHFVKVKIPV